MQHWVSFYSYKGGVGRSTSLVNSAFSLASSGQSVVMVDFDIEAPGLSYWYECITGQKCLPTEMGIYEIIVKLQEVWEKNQEDDFWKNLWKFSEDIEDQISKSLLYLQLPDKYAESGGSLFLLPCHKNGANAHFSDELINWEKLFLKNDHDTLDISEIQKISSLFSDTNGLSFEEQTLDDQVFSDLRKSLSFGAVFVWVLKKSLVNAVKNKTRNINKEFIKDKKNRYLLDEKSLMYAFADMRTGRTLSSILLSRSISDTLVCLTSMHRQSVDGIIEMIRKKSILIPDMKNSIANSIIPMISPLIPDPIRDVPLLNSKGKKNSSIYEPQRVHSSISDIKSRIRNIIISNNGSNNIEVPILEVPYDSRIASTELIISHSEEDVGAAATYRKLALMIKGRHPGASSSIHAASTTLLQSIENTFSGVDIRENCFEHIIHKLKYASGSVKSLVLLGGISTKLHSDETADLISNWLIENTDAKFVMCYESHSNLMNHRFSNVDTERYEDTTKNITEKYENCIKMMNSISDKLRKKLTDQEIKERVKYIELSRNLSQYIMQLNDVIYLTPLTEKRSSDSVTFIVKKQNTVFWNQTVEYIKFHLNSVENRFVLESEQAIDIIMTYYDTKE